MKTFYPLLNTTVYVLLLSIVTISCNNKITTTENPTELCDLVWKSIPVRITNQHGEPLQLDDYYTIKTSTRDKISFRNLAGDSLLKAAGRYLVLSDSQHNLTVEDGASFEFCGFKNGHEVVRQAFRIGRDQCHVQLISGRSSVMVEE
jgi:hypothetical protein